jgi:hypothetical protein
MADDAMWIWRVAEWRASGEPATTFTLAREYSASALRYWAKRLGHQPSKSVQLARLVRSELVPVGGRGDVVIEVGRVRVTVGRDFDRATLRGVVETLTELDTTRER